MGDASILVATVAAAGAVAAGATALTRPRLAVGVLFLLASISRATLETPLGTMRPEMPAIAVVAVVLLVSGRFSALREVPRSIWGMAVAFGIFLAALAISSAFIAPGTAQSLRMVAWFAVSMTGGVVVFILVRGRPVDAIEPFAFAGAAMGLAGIVAAMAFLVAGPNFSLGIQDPNSLVPRVYAFGWETNLYASFLGMCAFFALEVTRRSQRTLGWLVLGLVLVGFALGITRGAYVGLGAGLVAYATVRVLAERRLPDLVRLGAGGGLLLVIGISAATVLLPNNVERSVALGIPIPTPPTIARSSPTGTPASTASSAVAPSASASNPRTATALPSITPDLYPDTVSFRLERVPIALRDLPHSPLVGFGAESFGQKHPDRHAGPGPDHIAILAVVVPYEAGLIGAGGLSVGFIILFLALWGAVRRASRIADWRTAGALAAFIGSLVCMLVAYQVTNALQFAVNWMIIGAAAALTTRDMTSAR